MFPQFKEQVVLLTLLLGKKHRINCLNSSQAPLYTRLGSLDRASAILHVWSVWIWKEVVAELSGQQEHGDFTNAGTHYIYLR